MRGIVVALAVACVTCSSGGHRPQHPYYVVPTSERANPQVIELDNRTSDDQGFVRARAPGEGTWWYAVDFAPLPGRISKLEVKAIKRSEGHEPVELALIVDERVIEGSLGYKVATVQLPETATSPTRVLVRVTTSDPAKFELVIRREHWKPEPEQVVEIPPDAAPSVPCDLNHPDPKNPRCCRAACDMRRRYCTGRIISGEKTVWRVGIGADKEIMVGAMGVIEQRGNHSSRVLVIQIDSNEALVEVLTPAQLDLDKLVADGKVTIFEPPAGCR